MSECDILQTYIQFISMTPFSLNKLHSNLFNSKILSDKNISFIIHSILQKKKPTQKIKVSLENQNLKTNFDNREEV